jgi:hypothetical protein
MANTKTAAAKTPAAKKSAESKQELVTKNDQLPAIDGIDMSQYAGGGMENTDRDSFAIPFLAVAQKMSPQVDKDNDLYNPDLEVGDLFLTTTGQIFKDEDGVNVVFCSFRRAFLRWAPRDQGGGFKGELAVSDVVAGKSTGEFKEVEGKLFADNGDLIRDTRIHYVMVQTGEDTYTPAVISLASTQIKKSKMLMTQLDTYKAKTADGRVYTPPSFAHVFHAETIAEQNDQGSWRGWKLTRSGAVTDPELFKLCVAFSESVRENKVSVDHNADAVSAGGASSDDNGRF